MKADEIAALSPREMLAELERTRAALREVLDMVSGARIYTTIDRVTKLRKTFGMEIQ